MNQKYQGQMVQGPNGNLLQVHDCYFQGQGYSLYLSSEINVGVKIYEVDKFITNKYIQIEKQSYQILKSHPYITSTRYGEIFKIPVILMEKGIILEKMFQKQIQGFNEPQILKILRDLSKAVSYCHSQGVIHRDIRSENIIYGDGKFKIQNFQKSTFQVYSKVPKEIKKQIQEDIEININSSIKAFEQVNLNLGLALNEKVDIYSIGCLLYTMLYNRSYDINLPIFTINDEWSVYSDKLYNLVKILLASNPKDRPSGNLIEQYIETFSSGSIPPKELRLNSSQIQSHAQSSNILNLSRNSSPVHVRSKSNNSPSTTSPLDISPTNRTSPFKLNDNTGNRASMIEVIEIKQSQENKTSLYTQMMKQIICSSKPDVNKKKPESSNRIKSIEDELQQNEVNNQIKKKIIQEQSKFKAQKKQTSGYQDLSLSEDEIDDPPELTQTKSINEIEIQNHKLTITKAMIEKDDFLVFPGSDQKSSIRSQPKDFVADFSNMNKTAPDVVQLLQKNSEFVNNPFANQQNAPSQTIRREQTDQIFQQQVVHNNHRQSLPLRKISSQLLNNQQTTLNDQQIISNNNNNHNFNQQVRQQNNQVSNQGNPFNLSQIQVRIQQPSQQNDNNQFYQIQQPIQQNSQQNRIVLQTQKTKAFELYNFITQELQSNANDWIIDVNELSLERQIGTGSSCEVFQGYWRDNQVAIKKMKIKSLSENHMKEFRREITALVKIKPQQNLVALIGISQKDDELYIVTEICAGGTLFDLLHRKKTLNLPWIVRIRIGHQIAQGMNYLHELVPPIIHRDLKSLNLLLENVYDENNVQKIMIKIADFGLARVQDDDQMMTGVLGTFVNQLEIQKHWMAPEIFESKPYSLKADVYSFGIVLWEVCSRETPYKSFTNPHAIMKYVTFDSGRPDLNLIQEGCPIIVKNLMMRCWDPEPNIRPGFLEILSILRSLM